jgi:hypothetical protein
MQGPASAGWQQGVKEFQNTRESDLANLFKQQELDKLKQMTPLDVQHRQGEIAAQGALLPGQQAQSETLQRANRIAGAVEPETIKASRAEQLGKVSAEQVKQLSELGHSAGMLGAQLESADPSRHASIRQQFLSERGIDPASVPGQYVLNSTPSKLKDFSTNISKLKDEFISHITGIETTTKSQEKIAGMNIAAGKFRDKTKGSVDFLEKALTSGKWDQAATAYDRMAQTSQEAGDNESAKYYQTKAKEYSDKYILSHQAPKPGGLDVGAATGMEVNPQPTTSAPALRNPTVAPTLSPQDKAAIDWANSNPRDPRAIKILKLHGM